MRRVTLSDIAREVGVSANTVSRALNKRGEISEETKRRIIRAAERLGYTPDLVARGLATNRTHAIGVVVPDQANPFYAGVLRGVWKVAEEHNYGVLLANAHGIESRELRVAESLLQRRVDGMILLTQNPAVAERVSRITPCVVAGRQYSGKGVGVVATDDVAGAKSAVEYLIERGRRRILYVGCHDRGGPALDRWAGYSKALREAGYKVYEPIDMHASMQAAYEYARKAEDLHEYDAIFAFNDLIAIGLLRGLAEQGIRVPNDVALIGYDDIEVADFVSPRLTTVRIPKEEMGVWAAQFIIEQSGKKPSDVERIMHTLPTMLVRRDSA